MIFTQKSMTKHLKFYQQHDQGQAGNTQGQVGAGVPGAVPRPHSEPCVQGRGRVRATLASAVQVLRASGLEPGLSRLEGIWCACRETSRFAGVGLRPREGSACRDPQ